DAAVVLGGGFAAGGFVGVAQQECFGDEVFGGGFGQAAFGGGDEFVDLGCDGRGQGEGLGGDLAGLEGRDVAGGQPVPQVGEAVAQFEGLAHEHPAGVGSGAEGGGEFEGCVFVDQGCAGAGQGDHPGPFGVGAGDRCGVGQVGVVLGDAGGGEEFVGGEPGVQ